MSQIRFKNTRTGRTIEAQNGKDAVRLLQVEADRRTGAEIAAQVRANRGDGTMPK